MRFAILSVIGAALVCQTSSSSWRPALKAHGIQDGRIIAAMEKVRRADYLPASQRGREMEDAPLPIGEGQTTSQPSLIALMIQELSLKEGCRVLEVGTGSGYQTALLGELCAEVYSIEILEPLATRAAAALQAHGYRNVHVRAGDGYRGWPTHAPFDGIVVGAGAAKVPQPLIDQLAPGGKLVIPVGDQGAMQLKVISRTADGKVVERTTIPVLFVPLTGDEAARDRRR